jgi:putative FmdB family regulatory protein
MPIYEYVCEKCGNHLELMQKVGDAPPKKCAKCKKGKMEKIFSRTSFQLKGSGWYASDYGKPSASGAVESKPESSKSESKSEKKTASKSEKKAESKPEKASTDSKAAPAA